MLVAAEITACLLLLTPANKKEEEEEKKEKKKRDHKCIIIRTVHVFTYELLNGSKDSAQPVIAN